MKKDDGPILDHNTLNSALKSLQQIVNEFENTKVDYKKTKLELEQCVSEFDKCKDDCILVTKAKESHEKQIQIYKKDIEAHEAKICQLEKDLQQISEKNRSKQHEIELERKTTKERLHSIEDENGDLKRQIEEVKEINTEFRAIVKKSDSKTEYLKDTLKEQKTHCDLMKNKFAAMTQEKEKIAEEHKKVKDIMLQQDAYMEELRSKINQLEGQLFNKKIASSLDSQHQEGFRAASLQHQNITNQQLSTLSKENSTLTEKILLCQQYYNELQLKCEKRESKLYQKIERLVQELQTKENDCIVMENECKTMENRYKTLENEYKIMENEYKTMENELKKTSEEIVANKHAHNNIFVSNSSEPLSCEEEFLESKHELNNILKDLKNRSHYQKELLLNMKSKKIGVKYDNNELAFSAINSHKLNIVSVESEERKALLNRLHKLQKENFRLTNESKDALMDVDVCRTENSELARKNREQEATIKLLDERILEKDIRREENTKLVQRIKSYQDKLDKLQEEIDAKEMFKQQTETLKDEISKTTTKSKVLKKENKALQDMVAKLNKDIDYMRKSSMKYGNTSCCMELKMKIEYMEKQNKELEKSNSVLGEQVKLSVECQEKIRLIEQSLKDREHELSKSQKELEEHKEKVKYFEYQQYNIKTKEQETKPYEQPNVNVHVHFDPQKILDTESKIQHHYDSTTTNKDRKVSDDNTTQNQQVISVDSKNLIKPNNDTSSQDKHQIQSGHNKKDKQQLENGKCTTYVVSDEEKECQVLNNQEECAALQQVDCDLKSKHVEIKNLEALLEESKVKIGSLEDSEQVMKNLIQETKRDLVRIQNDNKKKDDEQQTKMAELRKQMTLLEKDETKSFGDQGLKENLNDKSEMQIKITMLEQELQTMREEQIMKSKR